MQQEDIDAARKKTDEASPDDQEGEGEQVENKEGVVEGENEVGPGGDNKKTKKSKAALEEQEEEVINTVKFLENGQLPTLSTRPLSWTWKTGLFSGKLMES